MCMKRLVIATEGCGQMTSNDTYFSDSWFSILKMAEEMAAAGVGYCGPAKTIHKGFCSATLEKFMRDWTGGSYLVMKSTPIFTGERPLLDIGCKYNYRKVLGFIATEGLEVLKQVIPVYLVSLTFIIMFLFALLFNLPC